MIIFSTILFFATLLGSFVLNFVHYMHMFQLNSYNAGEQLHWIKNNVGNIVLRHILPLCAAVYMLLTALLMHRIAVFDLLLCSCVFLVSLVFAKPKKAKKKLVFTPRVIRMCVTSTVVYGAFCALTMIFLYETPYCFFLLCFWQIFSLLMPMIANFINKPIERGVNNHYINDAKRIINELPNLTVVGITGSYGKTSTKYYLQKLLSARYNVLMTPESYNTTMGVVKTVRGSLNATYDIFICEMGAKGVGEIKEICDIVKPRHSMITSIGPQHLESFKSIENIIKTKFEIADCITDGTVFLNYDNDYIKSHNCDKTTVSYGLNADNDYFADEISISEKGTSFTLRKKSGESKAFTTKLIGAHNVQNIVGAIAIANTLGIPLDELVMPVRRLECVPHRMEIIDRGNTVIIDDAFNSNQSGAKAALDALSIMNGYKVVVTPGMVELGEKEYELNKAFGAQIAKVADFAVLVGEKQAVALKDGLIEEGYPEEKIYIAKTLNDGLSKVDAINCSGKKKIVLLENDLPDNY